MFDRLIQFVIDFIDLFRFWVVIDCFEVGVVLTLGRHTRTIDSTNGLFGTGLHLVAPFCIEKTLVDQIVPGTRDLQPQSLVTSDGVQSVISVSLTTQIVDVSAFLLKYDDMDSLLKNCVVGIVSKYIQSHTWDELCSADLANDLLKAVRKRAHRWGVYVDDLQINDFTKARSLRLWVNNSDATTLAIPRS